MTDDYFDPFGNNEFDSIVRSFFGNNGRRQTRRVSSEKSEEEESELGFIENKDSVFLILEFPGYSEDEVEVELNDRMIEIKAKKVGGEEMQEYFKNKFKQGIFVSRKLPEFVNSKNFGHTFKNGILEVRFNKK